MRVLGVDPGLTRCGVGVVDGSVGRALTLVEVTVLRTPTDVEVGRRLQSIADALTDAIERTSPDVVAVERVFSQHNVRTVMGTARLPGSPSSRLPGRASRSRCILRARSKRRSPAPETPARLR